MKKKIIQVPVVKGVGSGQFFVENDIQISPPSPPVWKIERIDKWIEVYSFKAIPGKVLFNAYLWKNIVYKTVEDVCDQIVSGPLYHSTFKTEFGGFVEIDPIGCSNADYKEDYFAELLDAYVEGQLEDLHGQTTCKGQKVYCKLLEKDVIKITFKVVRIEHVPVDSSWREDGKDDDKENSKWGDKFCEKKFDCDKKDDGFKKDEDRYGERYFEKYGKCGDRKWKKCD